MNTVIAILSTIILAVTILALFLGILAYIVYKMRKRGAKRKIQPAKPAETIEVTPTETPKVEKQPPPIIPEQAPPLIRRYKPEEKKNQEPEWK